MTRLPRTLNILIGLLVVLVLANVLTFWPRKNQSPSAQSGQRPPGASAEQRPGPPSEEMRLQFQASLNKLPEEERQKVTERMEADRAFFASVRDLPEQERRQKIEEHMANNPPLKIAGFEPPAGGPSAPPPGENGTGSESEGGRGPGGPGGPNKGHIPEPTQRRSMDQRIVDSQRKTQS